MMEYQKSDNDDAHNLEESASDSSASEANTDMINRRFPYTNYDIVQTLCYNAFVHGIELQTNSGTKLLIHQVADSVRHGERDTGANRAHFMQLSQNRAYCRVHCSTTAVKFPEIDTSYTTVLCGLAGA